MQSIFAFCQLFAKPCGGKNIFADVAAMAKSKPGMTAQSLNNSHCDSWAGNVCSPDVAHCSETSDYSPFISLGFVSLPGKSRLPVRILRDTGAAQSFLLEGVVPLSDNTNTGTQVLVRGIEMGFIEVPLHRIKLSSGLVNGDVVVGVRPSLPVPDIELVLGNNLAGGNVWETSPVVMSAPLTPDVPDECAKKYPHVVPVCAVTRARAKQIREAEAQGCFNSTPQVVSQAVEEATTAIPPVDSQSESNASVPSHDNVFMTNLLTIWSLLWIQWIQRDDLVCSRSHVVISLLNKK